MTRHTIAKILASESPGTVGTSLRVIPSPSFYWLPSDTSCKRNLEMRLLVGRGFRNRYPLGIGNFAYRGPCDWVGLKGERILLRRGAHGTKTRSFAYYFFRSDPDRS